MIDTPWALLRQDNNEVKRLKRERDELQIKLKNWQEIANEFEIERNGWRSCAEALEEYVSKGDIMDLDYALINMEFLKGNEA